MNRGVDRLAQTLRGAIAMQTATPPVVELGAIQPDGSLKVDRFAVAIPVGEYLVTRRAAGDLQPGDRVLVVWADDDPVVVDMVEVSGRA